MTSAYPVPNEWFEDRAAADALYYEDSRYEDEDDDDDDLVYDDDDIFDDDDSRSIEKIRAVARELVQDGHGTHAATLRRIAADLARGRVQAHNAAVAAMARRVAPVQDPSPTGNCSRCGAPLPLTNMGRGRPRTLCTGCSPPRKPRR